ncbi:hypothetical protein AB0H07_06795 [Streptomyces sp. NPDC021354]|uniref:hypothetical protein n=1 Tax=Streptomyces sp. NPDC021354 TaxID=3154793 RepID=UPI0033D98994
MSDDQAVRGTPRGVRRGTTSRAPGGLTGAVPGGAAVGAAGGAAGGVTGAAAQGDRLLDTADRMLRRIVRLMELGERVDEARSGLVAKRLPRHPVLGYSDVVAFLVRNRATVPEAAGGAVLRRRRGREYLVQTFYLDADGTPLHRAEQAEAPVWVCRAQRLDEELAAAFGDADLIVFQGGA